MALDDLFHITVVYDVVGAKGEMVNTHVFSQTVWDSVTNRTDLNIELIDIVGDYYVADLMPLLSSQITLDRVEGYIINADIVGSQQVYTAAGTVGGDLSHIRTSPIVNKLTGLRGRSYRGRNYLPPLVEASVASGIISGGALADLQAFFDDLIDLSDGLGNEWKATVYSPTLSDPPTTYVDTPITSYSVNSKMGTVRGRFSTG